MRLRALARFLAAGALWLVLVGVAATEVAANPARVQLLERISGGSPFPGGCGSEGTFTRGAEGEPWLAVNPRRPRNLVVVYQQDRRFEGGAQLNVAAVTKDGGKSWRRSAAAGVSNCVTGSSAWQSDPWVGFDSSGVAHLIQDAGHPRSVKPAPFLFDIGIPVSSSRDGGLSWSRPMYVGPIPKEGEFLSNDRPTVTADPGRPAVAYAVWGQLGPPRAFGRVAFSMTVNHGRSWSPERIVFRDPGGVPWGAQVSVLPSGILICTFREFELGGLPLRAIRSTDGGRTWSRPVEIARAVDRHPFDPETGVEVRDEPSPHPAVTPDGTLHVVWFSVQGARSSPLFYSRSRDGGRTFAAPRKIVTGPWQHFEPALAATKNGTLGLAYYDFRHDKPGDGKLTTDVWFIHSHDGGKTWAREIHVAGPFDAATAPQTTNPAGVSGRFLGEYQGLAALRGGFAAAFTMAKPAAKVGPSDVFFARIRVARAHEGRRASNRSRAGRAAAWAAR